MEKHTSGLKIARDILISITFCLSLANLILMIVELARDSRNARRYITFKDRDELPF